MTSNKPGTATTALNVMGTAHIMEAARINGAKRVYLASTVCVYTKDFGGKEISAEKAKRELGWQPSVEFEDGLRRTVEWFRQKWGK